LLHAYSGSGDVDAVVTAFVLAATRASVSAGSIGRTDSSGMGSVRACGDKHVADDDRADTCLYARRPIMVSAGWLTRVFPAESWIWGPATEHNRRLLIDASRFGFFDPTGGSGGRWSCVVVQGAGAVGAVGGWV
jgi:hypothetical protein